MEVNDEELRINAILVQIASLMDLSSDEAMLSLAATKLDEIFVGRQEELMILNALWEHALEPVEHFVYVMLNAPGTGKTRLLRQFGEQLEHDGKGLYFHYQCPSGIMTTSELELHFLMKLDQLMSSKKDFITSYLESNSSKEQMPARVEKLDRVMKEINFILEKKSVTLGQTVLVLDKLSSLIPVFFVADEIQEFQKIVLQVDEPSLNSQNIDKETALHYFTRILKEWMRSRILMILSGTQYHVLSQIGVKIGSPIAQKVKPLVIRNFNSNEIDAYVEVVTSHIIQPLLAGNTNDFQKIERLIQHYRRFSHSFSGGHPRTLAFITELFFGLLPVLSRHHSFITYDEFISRLFSKVEEEFEP